MNPRVSISYNVNLKKKVQFIFVVKFSPIPGKYLYVEASEQYPEGTEAVMESPVYPQSSDTCKVELAYHMHGADVGSLRVEAVSEEFTAISGWRGWNIGKFY